jgi:hypothetical protein
MLLTMTALLLIHSSRVLRAVNVNLETVIGVRSFSEGTYISARRTLSIGGGKR